jgi:hypothetical protein
MLENGSGNMTQSASAKIAHFAYWRINLLETVHVEGF